MKRIICVALLAAACSRAPAPAPAPSAPAPAPAPDLDSRTPVPLLPMMANHQKQQMRQHLEAVQGIVAGLATDDFEAIAAAAATIMPSPGMAAQCRHMGAGAAGFTEAALHFHDTAAGIAEAAARRDHAGVATALGATLATCTGCHTRWRQQIVDEETYARLTRG